jgi:hypothetical protein
LVSLACKSIFCRFIGGGGAHQSAAYISEISSAKMRKIGYSFSVSILFQESWLAFFSEYLFEGFLGANDWRADDCCFASTNLQHNYYFTKLNG